MISTQKSEGFWQRMLKYAATVQGNINEWIRQEIIDDDPYDTMAVEEAAIIANWRLSQTDL